MCTSGKVIVLVGVSTPLFSTNNPYGIIQPMNTPKQHKAHAPGSTNKANIITNQGSTSKATIITNKAFTIIELLIVIVIIGVLVAITAVSYNGITKSAKEAALKSDLKQIPRFYVSTSKSIIKALINMRSFEIQLSPIG